MKEIRGLVKDHVPDLSKVEGLVAYYVVQIGEDQWLTFGVFEDEVSAVKWRDSCQELVQKSRVDEFISRDAGDRGFARGKVIFSSKS
jgi:hypothetical protein